MALRPGPEGHFARIRFDPAEEALWPRMAGVRAIE
jgi:hypothetical protein